MKGDQGRVSGGSAGMQEEYKYGEKGRCNGRKSFLGGVIQFLGDRISKSGLQTIPVAIAIFWEVDRYNHIIPKLIHSYSVA